MLRRILVIEDCESAFSSLLDHEWMSGQQIQCESAAWNGFEERQLLRATAQLLVLAPTRSMSAVQRFAAMLSSRPRRMPILALLPVDAEVECIETAARQADDFLIWRGDRRNALRERVLALLPPGVTDTARRLIQTVALANLIGRDPAFLDTLAKVPLFARSRGTVLMQGETGTGKELCARAIHQLSPRSTMPFIPVDCGALPEQLVENELFGHLRGAFTDAHRDQSGLLQMAEGGTLFLDEIDSLTLPAQAKLLRLIEDRTFRQLGSNRAVRADIRIVAATGADLEALVAQKRFRADLYFRLNVFRLRLPPLRERVSDIPLLARHFSDEICDAERVPRKTFELSALDKLSRMPWPGNVRELFNVIQGAVVLSQCPHIRAADLPGEDSGADAPRAGITYDEARTRALDHFERTYVRALMCKHAGNVTQSAIEAKKDRRAIGRLVKKHNIDRFGG